MRGSTRTLRIEGVLRVTDKAILVALKDKDGEEVWIPKSQVVDAEDVAHGDPDEIRVSDWWYKESRVMYND